jgi:hypothetical protein
MFRYRRCDWVRGLESLSTSQANVSSNSYNPELTALWLSLCAEEPIPAYRRQLIVTSGTLFRAGEQDKYLIEDALRPTPPAGMGLEERTEAFEKLLPAGATVIEPGVVYGGNGREFACSVRGNVV